RFAVGEILESDDFENLDAWEVQLEEREGFPEAHVEARDGNLDCLVPGRGATVWFKKKLKTRIAITYKVLCPTPDPAIKGVIPRDINNFWMASDRKGEDLFDSKRYTGAFDTYDKMRGYYASTGGAENRTTRMRRYPREINGKHANHLFLNSRDGDKEYLITPDKEMTVQLVAHDDLIQYIVDGRLVYELAAGDRAQAETMGKDGKKDTRRVRYDTRFFPVYKEGYFGFRMVRTHHIYSDFRVYSLKQPARQQVDVSSIDELREAAAKSYKDITMKPGTYVVSDQSSRYTLILLSGSDNTVDLTGVTIQTPVAMLKKLRRSRRGRRTTLEISGDNVAFKGGSFENTYPDEKYDVEDFGSYNQNPDYYPDGAINEFYVSGDDVTVTGTKLTVRGSSPYGYGNMYGIGGGAVVHLRKHCGILTTGNRPLLDGCHVKMEAFGHGIFFQGGDGIVVRNCVVEGRVRQSDDIYEETSEGDLPKKFGYKLQWPETIRGLPVPKDHMINLSEDGIRAYPGTRGVTVENCTVSKMRSGVKLYLAKEGHISDCKVTDCVVQGYSVPKGGTITRCSGNAAYGPLLYIHNDSANSQDIDLTVLPAPHSLGDHPLAAIKGTKNKVRFSVPEGSEPKDLRPIIVGYPLRFDFLTRDYPDVPKGYEKKFAKYAPKNYRASKNEIENDTPYPIIIGKLAEENVIRSIGKVTDDGKNNTVAKLD
ncbi:right-handed parallel beta-helix repeat-containing protein, partial [Verrucomicrobiales bacterium]|nr:right-handed parallel beta-helix repeat-containing protein [Verrucomicrobiales bacterium]